VIIAAIWFPLKVISASVRAGDDVRTIVDNAIETFTGAIQRGEPGDTNFLDQAAVTMSLVDEHGKFFYGATYLPFFVSPVPRLWWPEKPRMNEYQHIISTPGRPTASYGTITTLAGEGYANFGYVGAILFPALAAYLYGSVYYAAMGRPHDSVFRFLYLVLASMLIQVYRDGFISSLLFPAAAAMPMLALVLAHWVIQSMRLWPARKSELIGTRLSAQAGFDSNVFPNAIDAGFRNHE